MSEKTAGPDVEKPNPAEAKVTFSTDKSVKSQELSRLNENQVCFKGDSTKERILNLDVMKAPKGVDHDLEVDLSEVFDIPQDILFPQELNLHLQNRIKSLLEEKCKLSRALHEKDAEAQLLKAWICDSPSIPVANDSAEATGPALPTDVLSAEAIPEEAASGWWITELARRLREMSGELSATRLRCAAAENKIATLHEEKQTSDGLYKQDTPDYRALVEKIHVANAKLFDSRNQIHKLRNELKMAYKVLQNEVGDAVPISTLTTGVGNDKGRGWKGRAQQIQVLQQRVADLTTKLRYLTSTQRCSKSMGSGDAGVAEPQSVLARKTALQEAQKEAAEAVALANDAKKRFEGSKARIHLLTSEAANLRTRLRQLLDKGRRDEEYIKLMQSQSVEQTALVQKKDDALWSLQERHKSDVTKLQEDLEAERQRCQHLSASLGERDSRIHMLESRLWNQRCESNTTPQVPKTGRTDDPPARFQTALCSNDSNQQQNTDALVVSERLRLLELFGVLNGRLSASRKESGLLQEALQRERQRTARLETRLSRLELDRVGVGVSVRRNQLTVSRMVASAPLEKTDALTDKLQLAEEQVLTLQTRIDTLEKEKEEDIRRFTATVNSLTSTHDK